MGFLLFRYLNPLFHFLLTNLNNIIQMQLIKLISDFDYEIIGNDPLFLDKITQNKQKQGIGIKKNKVIGPSKTIIRTFKDGEVYAWCDDLFGQMKLLDN